MSPRVAVAVILTITFACGMIGLGLGYRIAVRYPEYYPSFYGPEGRVRVDPVLEGLTRGGTQGLAFGLFLSVALVALYGWLGYSQQQSRRRDEIAADLEVLRHMLENIQERLDQLAAPRASRE